MQSNIEGFQMQHVDATCCREFVLINCSDHHPSVVSQSFEIYSSRCSPTIVRNDPLPGRANTKGICNRNFGGLPCIWSIKPICPLSISSPRELLISFEVKLPSACSFIVDGLTFSCRCSTLHVSAYMAIFRCARYFTF
jgi:hypothetical protein